MVDIIKANVLNGELYTEIYPFLKRGVSRLNDEKTIGELVRDIWSLQKQLWCLLEDDRLIGIVLTSILDYPSSKRLLYYLVCCDNLDKCWNNRQVIENWASDNGCTMIEIFGRLGWYKKLSKDGYKVDYVSMIKNIEE